MVGGESFVFGEKTAPPGAITLKLSKKFWERKLGKRRSGQNGRWRESWLAPPSKSFVRENRKIGVHSGQNGRFEREAPPPGAGGTRRLT